MITQVCLEPDVNNAARARVVEYYDECWNDYRILWRTDQNGSIHFGFFEPDETGERARFPLASALGATVAAGASALRGRTNESLRWMQIAAQGRAARHDRAQARMTEVCAEAAGLRPHQVIVDAGCGVGGTDLWLAEHFGVRVLGLNVQPRHAREAKQNAARHPSGNRVSFCLQDFTNMGVADAAVDVVWGLESVCHCAEKRAFVREAWRVLKPGGRLMVADFFRSRDELQPEEASRMRAWTDGWALPNLASVEGFSLILASEGFRDVRVRDIGANVLPSSLRLFKASLVALPINAVLEACGWRSRVAGRNVRAARHQYTTLRDGIWTYAIFIASK